MELAIDTSTRFASIGISSGGELVAELTWRSDRNHSVELTPSIISLLRRLDISVSDLEAIYIASGPGGFSALRVGMSTAKSMAMSLEIPLVSVGTLDIEAQPYLGLGSTVCALIGAGRTRVYLGEFKDSSRPAYKVVAHEELFASVSSDVIFCGEGVSQVSELLRGELGASARITDTHEPTRRAGVLASLGCELLQQGKVADAMSLEPLYLRSSQVNMANRTWRNR